MKRTLAKSPATALFGAVLISVAQFSGAKEPVFELLRDIHDDRRQVEMLWLTPDEGGEPRPAILFVHGFQPAEEDEPFAPGAKAMLEEPPRYPLFEIFRRKGFLVAAVSQSGYGRTDGPLDFCGPLSQQAIATAIDALQAHPQVIKSQIYLHGRSRGAVASSMAATRLANIAGVILESGVYDLETEYHSLLTKAKEPYHYIAANIELEAGITEEVFRERSVLLTDLTISVPTLIIHGEADTNTPSTHAIALEAHLSAKGSDVELALFSGAGHHVPAEQTAPVIEAFVERTKTRATARQSAVP